MVLDIWTLVFITSVIFATQTIAFFVQYLVNRTYVGLGWWLTGAILQALGFFLFLTLNSQAIWMLSIAGNPLIFLGQLFLNIGIIRFLGKQESGWVFIALFAGFIISYYYFIFVDNSIFGRAVVVYASAALISLKIAYTIFRGEKKHFSGSANFVAAVFFACGCSYATMTIVTLLLPHLGSYADFYQAPIRIVAFIVPLLGSTLWTFGFIIMVNQRLNAENSEEKEKLQRVFNTGPDANSIARMRDGLMVDVNAGFSALFGYARDEILGKSILDIWSTPGDKRRFEAELGAKGVVENREFEFVRKDGSRFIGIVSGSAIAIDDQAHAISVIRDITERKLAENRIRDLLAEKELVLKEVHHRIKNNMATLSSLLRLQATTLDDPIAIEALEDAGSRVDSMMVLYTRLYATGDFSDVSLRTYLPALVDEIVANFPNSESVKTETRVDDVVLDANKVQPLGIILNELLTNSMKHAFAGRDDGVIVISAAVNGRVVSFVVEDNGNGMPDSVDFENSPGFGLMLVGALTAQLQGTIRTERGKGTRIVLEFEL